MQYRWLVLGGVLLLGGCSSIADWAEGDKTNYKGTSTLPPLEIPPDLTAPSRDSRYAVPDAAKSTATLSGYQAESRDKKPGASGTLVLPSVERMRVERAGAQRWLVVEEPPEKLWPAVKDFWQENGFLLKTDLPEFGVMETDWAEVRNRVAETGLRGFLSRTLDSAYSSSERDKFRTRLEPTADGKGTEIYISHRGMEEVYTTARDPATGNMGDSRWQPRKQDPELEAEYLRRLMVRLGAQQDRARTLTANATPDGKAEIKKGVDGLEKLEVPEPFDRVWRRVGLALDRVGFTVEDRDRAKGVYFVRYADPELEKDPRGFLTRLFTSESKVRAEQYRVQITQSGAQSATSGEAASEVSVLNKDGAVDKTKTGQRILSLLHEQLK
jgi:outer membrane protein assembly factor BamC